MRSIAATAARGATFGGMLTCALSALIIFAPADNWLSRMFGPQLAGTIWFTVLGVGVDAVTGGIVGAGAAAAAFHWLWRR